MLYGLRVFWVCWWYMGTGEVGSMGVSSEAFCSGRDITLLAGDDVILSCALPKVWLGELIDRGRLE